MKKTTMREVWHALGRWPGEFLTFFWLRICIFFIVGDIRIPRPKALHPFIRLHITLLIRPLIWRHASGLRIRKLAGTDRYERRCSPRKKANSMQTKEIVNQQKVRNLSSGIRRRVVLVSTTWACAIIHPHQGSDLQVVWRIMAYVKKSKKNEKTYGSFHLCRSVKFDKTSIPPPPGQRLRYDGDAVATASPHPKP